MSEPNAPGKREHAKDNERSVTDPVTHLPLTIHDATEVELEQIPPPRSEREMKERDQRRDDVADSGRVHKNLEKVVFEATHQGWWPNPDGEHDKARIQTSIVAGAATAVGSLVQFFLWLLLSESPFKWIHLVIAPLGCCILGISVAVTAASLKLFQHSQTSTLQGRNLSKRTRSDSDVKRNEEAPESAAWLNSFIKSLWPIVNPALFTSIADMLEDSLQATLPKLVHGVRIADLGQGSVPVTILGIRWLAAGSAAKEIDGMKAEEGDFINMEVALAYRARNTEGGLKDRSGNAHLLVEFWITGGITVPVWIELTGLVATARIRIQLTPNPPFLSLMTLTLLGQPKVLLNCTPLAKNFFNVMDVPGLSSWVQSSIDAALAEYVAPRSINLDLKSILMGEEKMDTEAVGIVIITIRRASGFKHGDEGKFLKSSDGKKGDVYVTAGWSKWGKPLWSTRIIEGEGNPVWEETTALLVGPAELNAQEQLMLQLWDSDSMTADDMLGRVELSLKEIMTSEDMHNKISNRQDSFTSEDGESWPGTLHWECGYFSKTDLEHHLARDKTREIKENIMKEAEDKLREAKSDNEDTTGEIDQQKKEDLKESSDKIIADSRPSDEWPSGILLVRIEQISGLEIQKIRESEVRENDEDAGSDELPSAYCSIIINHERVYKTRTKVKSGNPFYDAGTERFIRDWRTTTVLVSVHDGRLHEDNPLLGAVVLPLPKLFAHSSHFGGSLPLVGGIGYGRMKLTLLFRSVQLQLPKRLRGWNSATLEVQPDITSKSKLPQDLVGCSLVLRTLYGRAKMAHSQDAAEEDTGIGNPVWRPKHGGQAVRLPILKRYASCLLILFRKRALGPDLTPAFCTLWLKDIPDEEQVSISLPIQRSNVEGGVHRGQGNAIYQDQDHGSEEHIGTLELKVTLLPGLGGGHWRVGRKEKGVREVMEVLEAVEGEGEIGVELNGSNGDSSESDSSDSDPEDDQGGQNDGHEDAKAERPSGVLGELKEYKNRKGDLHRKHRGLMQWGYMRKAAWVGHGVENRAEQLGGKIKGAFKHQDKNPGIEKEV